MPLPACRAIGTAVRCRGGSLAAAAILPPRPTRPAAPMPPAATIVPRAIPLVAPGPSGREFGIAIEPARLRRTHRRLDPRSGLMSRLHHLLVARSAARSNVPIAPESAGPFHGQGPCARCSVAAVTAAFCPCGGRDSGSLSASVLAGRIGAGSCSQIGGALEPGKRGPRTGHQTKLSCAPRPPPKIIADSSRRPRALTLTVEQGHASTPLWSGGILAVTCTEGSVCHLS